jgi:hypothetical protein
MQQKKYSSDYSTTGELFAVLHPNQIIFRYSLSPITVLSIHCSKLSPVDKEMKITELFWTFFTWWLVAYLLITAFFHLSFIGQCVRYPIFWGIDVTNFLLITIDPTWEFPKKNLRPLQQTKARSPKLGRSKNTNYTTSKGTEGNAGVLLHVQLDW